MRELSLNILDIAMNSVRANAAHVTVQLTEDAEGWLTLSISDDGKGMDRETLKRVTDPFYTTRTTRKVGLGLPFLRLAAEQTGGEMEITSTSVADDPENHGTQTRARFDTKHIDCQPLGDLIETVCTLIQGNPEIEWLYLHTTPAGEVRLDTEELRAILGEEVPLSANEVISWIRDYLDEQYTSLK